MGMGGGGKETQSCQRKEKRNKIAQNKKLKHLSKSAGTKGD